MLAAIVIHHIQYVSSYCRDLFYAHQKYRYCVPTLYRRFSVLLPRMIMAENTITKAGMAQIGTKKTHSRNIDALVRY